MSTQYSINHNNIIFNVKNTRLPLKNVKVLNKYSDTIDIPMYARINYNLQGFFVSLKLLLAADVADAHQHGCIRDESRVVSQKYDYR